MLFFVFFVGCSNIKQNNIRQSATILLFEAYFEFMLYGKTEKSKEVWSDFKRGFVFVFTLGKIRLK